MFTIVRLVRVVPSLPLWVHGLTVRRFSAAGGAHECDDPGEYLGRKGLAAYRSSRWPIRRDATASPARPMTAR
jgi:hypothetical protein